MIRQNIIHDAGHIDAMMLALDAGRLAGTSISWAAAHDKFRLARVHLQGYISRRKRRASFCHASMMTPDAP